ncbi:MAG: transcriptional repressor NrdR [Nocardioidaceae bacterium]|nr:transcriptional repressor NrdR [Nocardioidaceae bacterium]
MHCPYCQHTDTRVLDSRVADDGAQIRRRRACQDCERRFTTVEQIQLAVVKRSGATEPFNRDKVVDGVRKACKGRPVTDADLARLGQLVETELRAGGAAYVPADEVGLAVLEPLRSLDQVAYLRFASVYKAFSSVDDFADEVAALMAERAEAPAQPPGPEPGPEPADRTRSPAP